MATQKPVKLPEIFFDTRSEKYWLKLDAGGYLHLDSRNIKLHFRRAGFDVDYADQHGLKNGEAVLVKAQLEKRVDYAGPVAGLKCGAYENGGKRILVTSEPRLIEPKRGPFPRIERFLEQLFGEQLDYFLYWLKVAHASLLCGVFTPGQLLAMAGPPQCGKSFCHVLITKALGGRMAKPYRYMTGQTHFNSDLAGSEHLVIEDENAKANTGARREFGTQIKDWTVNENISVHAKGREAVTLGFYRRLSLSVNWETEYLLILPPMDSSILDKVMLFKCSPAKLSPDRAKNIRMLDDELPALLYYLQRQKIPAALQDDRFGVKAYHNPEILEILSAASAETQLDELIDQVIFERRKDAFDSGQWEGCASDLQKELVESAFRFQADKLLSYSSACGVFLARLETRNPERYSKHKNNGRTKWLIKRGK